MEQGSPIFRKVRKDGWEYILVLTEKRDHYNSLLPPPCFMGFPGYALKAIHKLTSNSNHESISKVQTDQPIRS